MHSGSRNPTLNVKATGRWPRRGPELVTPPVFAPDVELYMKGCKGLTPCFVKGEDRSWSNLILEERVKFSKQNSENRMKIGWKIRKLWHFKVSQIFKKHFLTSRYEYANEWVDDVIASQFSIHFVHRNHKKFIFHLWECYTCLNSSLNRCRIMLTPIYLNMRDILSQVWAKK